MESLSSPHRTRKTVWVSIAAPEIEHADCLCSRHISVLRSGCPSWRLQRVCGRPLLQTFRSLVTNVKARYLSRISILSVIGIRLAFVHQFMSRSRAQYQVVRSMLSVVGICLMSLFTYLAILSRFLVRLAVGNIAVGAQKLLHHHDFYGWVLFRGWRSVRA